MTYIVAQPCIDLKDRSCVDVCPVDCIHDADRILVIDPEECIDCGACEPECPVEAIFPEDALPSKWEPFVKINYAYGDGIATVNHLVEDYLGGEGGTGVREPRRPAPRSPEDGDMLDPED
jgi:NAD-dependent dihydropyrimidine dehydrogenase PreA subunit